MITDGSKGGETELEQDDLRTNNKTQIIKSFNLCAGIVLTKMR